MTTTMKFMNTLFLLICVSVSITEATNDNNLQGNLRSVGSMFDRSSQRSRVMQLSGGSGTQSGNGGNGNNDSDSAAQCKEYGRGYCLDSSKKPYNNCGHYDDPDIQTVEQCMAKAVESGARAFTYHDHPGDEHDCLLYFDAGTDVLAECAFDVNDENFGFFEGHSGSGRVGGLQRDPHMLCYECNP